MPAASAARGDSLSSARPRKRMVPAAIFSSPKAARISSDLPQPTSPAMPTTSPARTVTVASRTEPSASESPSIASATSPGLLRISGNSAPAGRPVISSISAWSLTSAALTVVILRPSRRTVIRSASRRISASRCET